MRRIESEELLDHHQIARADRDRSLRDLRRINRYLGGHRAYRRLVLRLTSNLSAFSILDLGTGSADLLEPFQAAPCVGLDSNIEHLLFGQSIDGRVQRVTGDALHLPFAQESFDIVGSSHFFHHFSFEENVVILSESLRVARRGVFVTDTRRHPLALAAVRLLGVTPLIGRVTRHDAPASVRQGYTAAEVREIAQRLPVARVEIFSIFPFRFGLILWKST